MCKLLEHGYVSSYVDSLLKTVCVTSFFGFLRCGEITISQREFDPSRNICLSDIRICETHIMLHLKTQKTDPYKRGMSIPLFKIESNRELCPYLALTKYLELRKVSYEINT